METKERLKALDVLRGITIASMILVNTPGSWSYVYWPLLHAKWHGFTPTDAVFPFFLFIVGVSIHFAFKNFKPGENKKALKKIIKRTIIIFAIGLFLNLFPKFNFETVRYFGILQRIAIAYGVGASLCLFFKKRNLAYIIIGILVLYWAILYFFVPENPFGPQTNLVGKIDLYLFGSNHVWKGLGFPFDPEGLLSTLPSISTVLIGSLTGGFLSNASKNSVKIKTLLSYGISLMILGYVWGFVFPINKSLWTSSYVCFAAGLAMVVLALLIWIIDVKKYSKWSIPFIHFGTNPLFIFVFSGLYVKTMIYLIKITNAQGETTTGLKYIYQNIFVPFAGNMNGSLFFAIAHIFFFWSLVYVLYRNKIFIKI
ncbi:heparan-alpha-glucosaminide N-acetyltransferase domain-containing protein [Polaribacter sp. MSW13]|uniref:Heparan-alpha-glucosaminide N-acetyltransferase domain-containing protein n=1 Tax=Polaribacter marinus TaxID=2916838 RepID=A0A9X1VLN1_9FLAO|nr:heparan-alpha-glucosaminide N-acetyltransferase domain-containing protein [Polaribacter marinus]MCI2228759.1 heparan-alpha-glucosaminide N-acetyltransferase domain-containing protein [Polaribacter marinus]